MKTKSGKVPATIEREPEAESVALGESIPGVEFLLTLEGEQFAVTGGVQGADGPGNSFVWDAAAGLPQVIADSTYVYIYGNENDCSYIDPFFDQYGAHHLNTYCDPHADHHADTLADCNRYSDLIPHSIAHSDVHCFCNTGTLPDADETSDCDAHAHIDSHAIAYANAESGL